MRLVGLWIGAILAGLIGTTEAIAAEPLRVAECQPVTMITSDNDIRLSGDRRSAGTSVETPPKVLAAILAASADWIARVDREMASDLTCEYVFPRLHRVSAPQGRNLYVAEVQLSLAGSYFYLLLYDPNRDDVTPRPAAIWAKWTGADGLLEAPFVTFADLLQDGHRQIVFQERAHNGTMYNAVIYHYFDVGPDLALTRVLARETRVQGLRERDGEYVRELRPHGGNRVKLSTFHIRPSGARRSLGYAILESAPRHPVSHRRATWEADRVEHRPRDSHGQSRRRQRIPARRLYGLLLAGLSVSRRSSSASRRGGTWSRA
jgi:hypothetical protein